MMSVEKSYNVTLKISTNEDGSFESVRLLKGRSLLQENLLLKINKALQESLVPIPAVKTTVAIGDDAEQKVMNHLLNISKVNSDFAVIDTSSLTGHGDIAVIYQSKRICIEVKCYSSPVPMKEIEKYHRSLELGEYDAGIIIQVENHGYCAGANIRSPIDIRVHAGKPSAYITGIDLDLLYPIISMHIQNLASDKSLDDSELEIKRKALVAIHEKVVDLRNCIDVQKKSLTKMEGMIEAIAKLSC